MTKLIICSKRALSQSAKNMVTTQRHVLANKPELANISVYSYNDIQHYDMIYQRYDKTLYIVHSPSI